MLDNLEEFAETSSVVVTVPLLNSADISLCICSSKLMTGDTGTREWRVKRGGAHEMTSVD